MSQRWHVFAPAGPDAGGSVHESLAHGDNVYLFGDDDSISALIASLPSQSVHCETLVRIQGRGLPDLLLYSELFGHLKGSFVGAYRDKPGLVCRLDGRVLVIEHFDELSSRLQTAIKRFAETGEVLPLGASAPTAHARVRVLLTGRRAANGKFRQP